MIMGWACYVLICHQQKRTFGGRRTSRRGFASCLHEKCKKPLNKNTHGMYGGACDAAIAKASADVTHVQSQSQDVGSGDKGLGVFMF